MPIFLLVFKVIFAIHFSDALNLKNISEIWTFHIFFLHFLLLHYSQFGWTFTLENCMPNYHHYYRYIFQVIFMKNIASFWNQINRKRHLQSSFFVFFHYRAIQLWLTARQVHDCVSQRGHTYQGGARREGSWMRVKSWIRRGYCKDNLTVSELFLKVWIMDEGI